MYIGNKVGRKVRLDQIRSNLTNLITLKSVGTAARKKKYNNTLAGPLKSFSY